MGSEFIRNQKNSNKIQGPHIFFFTLLVILGNYEPTLIVTITSTTKVVEVRVQPKNSGHANFGKVVKLLFIRFFFIIH